MLGWIIVSVVLNKVSFLYHSKWEKFLNLVGEKPSFAGNDLHTLVSVNLYTNAGSMVLFTMTVSILITEQTVFKLLLNEYRI